MKINLRKFAIFLIFSAMTAYAVVFSWPMMWTDGWETPWILLVLAGAMAWHVYKRFVRTTPPAIPGRIDKFIAWAMLPAAVAVALMPYTENQTVSTGMAVMLVAIGCIIYCASIKMAVISSGFALLTCIIIPIQDQFFLTLSQPLRLISTNVSVFILKCSGMQIDAFLTTIYLNGTNIAITDACSGIQQFEAMLLLGYFIARNQQILLKYAVFQYCFILPAIIIANSIRIIITILMYNYMGDEVLSGMWHRMFGFGQIAATLIILWSVGAILREITGGNREKQQ